MDSGWSFGAELRVPIAAAAANSPLNHWFASLGRISSVRSGEASFSQPPAAQLEPQAFMEMPAFFLMIDPSLIRFYRITGYAPADFVIGTIVLACIAILAGELTLALAYWAVRKHIDKLTAEADKYQELSMAALIEGDRQSYKAANHLANEAFGRSFFMQIALSAAFLWPVFFALAWMQYRFAGLEFPLPFSHHHSFGFVGVFILVFIPVYLVFRKVRYRLPFFRRLKANLNTCGRQRRGLKTFASLLAPPSKPAADENGK
jgi:hypothetical protein